jgi:hypothetical protein
MSRLDFVGGLAATAVAGQRVLLDELRMSLFAYLGAEDVPWLVGHDPSISRWRTRGSASLPSKFELIGRDAVLRVRLIPVSRNRQHAPAGDILPIGSPNSSVAN